MTTPCTAQAVVPAAASALRARVRALLEGEYLRLCSVDRPALLELLAECAEDASDPEVPGRELEVLERRITALHEHLAEVDAESAAGRGRALELDLGEGPVLMLVSEIDVADEQVIAADSPVGQALRSAVPGQLVVHPTPPGGGQVRVIAVEGSPVAHAEPRVGLDSTVSATIVVPSQLPRKPRGRVVVGLREVADAAEALAIGFAQANRRATELAVTVIRDDPIGTRDGDGLEPAFHAPDERDVTAADELVAAVTAAGRAFPGVPVTSSLRTGHFSDVLIELSRAADLVVLGMGRRPTGMGRSDLLVATRADCPVIVVRERSQEVDS